MKRKEPRFKKGQLVHNSMLNGDYEISNKPDWNGFTYMYSFKNTDMSCGEMYLSRVAAPTSKEQSPAPVEAGEGFTPGEWKVIQNHPVFDNSLIIAVKDEVNSTSFRDKYYMVCEMTEIRGDSFTDNSKHTEANARLIASAPTLLKENEQLKEEVRQLTGYQIYVSAKIYFGDDSVLTFTQWIEAGEPKE